MTRPARRLAAAVLGLLAGAAHAAPVRFESAPALLDALAASDERFTALEARLQYTREFAIQGDVQQRRGTMRYARSPAEEPGAAPVRRFAIRFEELLVGERLDQETQEFIFDGSWLVERLPAQKQFIKRQIVRPGERLDPFDAGGPMPLPIGRVRDDLLERFEATLPPASDGAPQDLLGYIESKSLTQLRLVPRPDRAEREDYVDIRVWYRVHGTPAGDVILPEIARAESQTGDTSLVFLIGPNLAPQLPDDTFLTTPPARGDGWDVRIEPWREPAPGETP